jgi:hypothetical protein
VRSGDQNIPTWFQALHERGLFIQAPGTDFQFYQKIPSYALAYWAWEVAYTTIDLFVRAIPNAATICDYVVHNFGLYRDVCPPDRLGEFDQLNALTLTNWIEDK